MADREKSLHYLKRRLVRLTPEQRDAVPALIMRSLITRMTDIAWEDAVDYAVKTAKSHHPKPVVPRDPDAPQLVRSADGQFGVVRRG